MEENQVNTRGIVVYPPNRGIDRKMDFSTVPVVYDNLLFIDFNDKGQAIVGASNVTGSLWENTLCLFKNKNSLMPLKYDKAYVSSTVSDGRFLDETTIALAEDTGMLNILRVGGDKLESVNYFRHSDRIPRLSVWKNSPKVLTCSGNSVNIWDVDSTSKTPTHKYVNFHTDLVNDVDALQTDFNIFASASMDRKCCIWDTRDPIPSSVLYSNEFASLTSVSINQKNSNYVVVGTEAGDIYLVDRREPKEFISVANCNCNIYRVLFDESNRLAVCGDTNKVLVFKCEDEIINNVYCNDKHNAIARGLAWHNEILYSCGFDKQIVKHVLN